MEGLDEHRFHFDDLALLKSGQFSDAQLTFGDKTWHVHKSIVCLRSGYMKDVFSHSSTTQIEDTAIMDPTEEHIDCLLEFIYSGSIKSTHDLYLADCVQLCEIGKDFRVDGMVCYTVKTLWDKLTPMLQALSGIPAVRDTDQSWTTITKTLGHPLFVEDFKLAVLVAYLDPGNACQLVLADFVWAARNWLLCDPVIDELNTEHPQFGSHILTTLQKGPQSPFLPSATRINRLVNPPTLTLCTLAPPKLT